MMVRTLIVGSATLIVGSARRFELDSKISFSFCCCPVAGVALDTLGVLPLGLSFAGFNLACQPLVSAQRPFFQALLTLVRPGQGLFDACTAGIVVAVVHGAGVPAVSTGVIAFGTPVRVPKAASACVEVAATKIHGSKCPRLNFCLSGRGCGVFESYLSRSSLMKSVSLQLHVAEPVHAPPFPRGDLLYAPNLVGLLVRIYPIFRRIDAIA